MLDLDRWGLRPLMERTSGRAEVRVALIDGPVAQDHPAFAGGRLHPLGPASCADAESAACAHGTFVAGILAARRGSPAPALAPGCTLLVRPIFAEGPPGDLVSASGAELADALLACIDGGARVVNLSVALVGDTRQWEARLAQALDLAAQRGVLIVAAAGNQGTIGGTVITRHPWVIPVVACDARGRPLAVANLGASIGRAGLCAPGESITSLGPAGRPATYTGTSAAAPFVSGALALLASLWPDVSAGTLRRALLGERPRPTLVPPPLDAWGGLRALERASQRKDL